MFNNEIKTPCGKTMKSILYKYHKKKCDKCKGKRFSVNPEYMVSSIHNRKGKEFTSMTCKDFKSKGFRQGKMRTITNDLIDARKSANKAIEEDKKKLKTMLKE